MSGSIDADGAIIPVLAATKPSIRRDLTNSTPGHGSY